VPDDHDPTEDQPGWAAPDGTAREPDDAAEPDAPSPETAIPAPPPPELAYEPAPLRRSKVWLYVLLAICGVTLSAVIAGTILFVDRTAPPYDAARDFFGDLVHNRRAEAAARLCERDRPNAEAILARLVRQFFGEDGLVVNALSVDRDGARATVEYAIDTNPGDGVDNVTHELLVVEEDGDWRVCPGQG
jgi:hypothetical protein